MKSAISRLFNDIAYYLYPERCVGCKDLPPAGGAAGTLERCFCDGCRRSFIASCREACPGCGKLAYECECSTEFLAAHGINRAYKCFHYSKMDHKNASSRLIYSLKSTANRDVIRLCAKLLSDRIERQAAIDGFDISEYVITFAPRGGRSKRKFGDDHMKLAAGAAASNLNIPCRGMFKNVSSGEQKRKTAAERAESASLNVRIRRHGEDYARGAKFIILDDVLTTGATVYSCAEKLFSCGALDVKIFTLASAFRERKK